MASVYKTIYPVKYLRDHLTQQIRPDGREFLGFRPVSVNVSSITQADSSAVFKIGNTTVVCGIKAELATPKPEAPDSGYLIPNVGLSPLCSSKFRPGPPGDQAQVTTKIVDNILWNSQVIDLRDLCICKDKLAWVLYCDLECIDSDGSIIDACLGALMAALSSLTLPEVLHNPESQSTRVNPNNRSPVPLKGIFTATTFAVFEENLLLADPTDEEESQALARFTVVMNNGEICYMHKPGGVPISSELLSRSIARARSRSENFKSLITTAISPK
ncbi:exosome complex component RRP43-like [Fopius arisanus]|uniref:Ribosomal RNA-processing protein 43 n=2 Tax=Braconidae TaxID=7402 RepID=A0A9R1U729_9HYME|nr:PREDICTED: exosome complex component RRP43-like [Fopius arisanus]